MRILGKFARLDISVELFERWIVAVTASNKDEAARLAETLSGIACGSVEVDFKGLALTKNSKLVNVASRYFGGSDSVDRVTLVFEDPTFPDCIISGDASCSSSTQWDIYHYMDSIPQISVEFTEKSSGDVR